jgi:hypothetical protein
MTESVIYILKYDAIPCLPIQLTVTFFFETPWSWWNPWRKSNIASWCRTRFKMWLHISIRYCIVSMKFAAYVHVSSVPYLLNLWIFGFNFSEPSLWKYHLLNYIVQCNPVKFAAVSAEHATFSFSVKCKVHQTSQSHVTIDGQSVSQYVVVLSSHWNPWPDIMSESCCVVSVGLISV